MDEQVDRFLTELESDRGFSQNTISAYRNDLTQFVSFVKEQFGLERWQELSESILTSYVLSLRERGYARATVARKVAAVRSFCGYLQEVGTFRSNPTENLVSPKVEKCAPRAITVAEMRRLLSQSAKAQSPEAVRDVAMLCTLYSTGMRVSEMMALDIDDVDLDAGTVSCGRRPDKVRQAPLSADATRALRAYLDVARPLLRGADQNDALFLNHRGSRLTRQGFWLILKSHAEAAGVKDITPHTIRHSFAVHQLETGRDVRDVQRIMGHMSITTTQAYKQLVRQNGRAQHAGRPPVAREAGELAYAGAITSDAPAE